MTNRDRAETSEQPTRPAEALPASPERLIAHRYELLTKVGAGASAVTWRARDTRLGRIVAVKLLRPALAAEPGYARRFEQEAQLAASISHPNVVDVYDVGQDGDQLYIVMQFVAGEDLKHVLQREGRLAPQRAVALEQHILDGLDAIHRAGIIHRDIKPQNVLIGDDGMARVTDFGVAHIDAGEGLTSTGMAIGTVSYMAPEQAEGGPVSEATDIYAAGVVLFELLTGRLPFNGPTPMAIMLAHIRQEVTPPSRVAPDAGISPALDGVVLQAMAKAPGDRFRTARAMNQALSGAMRGATAGTTQRIAAPAVARTTRTLPAPPSGPAAPVSTSGAATPPSGRSSAPVAALLGLLLLIALAGAGWYIARGNLFGGTGDQGNRAPAVVDATATATPPNSPTAVSTAPPTATVPAIVPLEPTRTSVPPSPTPTDTPAPTATSIPTEPPTPTETPIPTMPPTQPLIVPQTQEGAVENQIVPASTSTQAPLSLRQASQNQDGVAFGPADWLGGRRAKVRGEEVLVIPAGEAATLRFRLTGAPAGGVVTLSFQGAAQSSDGVAPSLAVSVNGAHVTPEQPPLPVTTEENTNKIALGDVAISLPGDGIVEGENTVQIANGGDPSAPGGQPALVLAGGTLLVPISDQGGAVAIESAQPQIEQRTDGKPTKKAKPDKGNNGNNGNGGDGNDGQGN